MGHNSRKMQRLFFRAHYVVGTDLAGESKEPPNVGLQGPSSPFWWTGNPHTGRLSPPRPPSQIQVGLRRLASRPLRPSPGPSIACLPPTTKTKLPPTIEDGTSASGGSASGGLNISAGCAPMSSARLREGSGAGNSAQSQITPSPQNPRYQLTIGIRRSRPKFLGVILTPGAACRRLYSFRSTALITRFTISSSNPMLMMSAGDLSCST